MHDCSTNTPLVSSLVILSVLFALLSLTKSQENTIRLFIYLFVYQYAGRISQKVVNGLG